MNVKRILRGYQSLLREKGPQATRRAVMDRLYVRWFEWRFGIHSEAFISLKELGFDNEFYRGYAATDYRSFPKALDSLSIRSGKDVFLDFGSGLGRAVIMAATRPFRRAIGVEISPQLNARARENVRNALPRLECRDIEIVTSDATQFAIPGDVTVIYFFNPFCGDVLAKVLENIRDSLAKQPRSLRLMARVPAKSGFEEEIRQHAWLVQERELVVDANNRYLFLAARTR